MTKSEPICSLCGTVGELLLIRGGRYYAAAASRISGKKSCNMVAPLMRQAAGEGRSSHLTIGEKFSKL